MAQASLVCVILAMSFHAGLAARIARHKGSKLASTVEGNSNLDCEKVCFASSKTECRKTFAFALKAFRPEDQKEVSAFCKDVCTPDEDMTCKDPEEKDEPQAPEEGDITSEFIKTIDLKVPLGTQDQAEEAKEVVVAAIKGCQSSEPPKDRDHCCLKKCFGEALTKFGGQVKAKCVRICVNAPYPGGSESDGSLSKAVDSVKIQPQSEDLPSAPTKPDPEWCNDLVVNPEKGCSKLKMKQCPNKCKYLV